MKKYFILLPILFFAALQGAFLPLNIVLLIVVFCAFLGEAKESLGVAFISGLVLDLASGGELGYSSLFFLVATFLIVAYSRRFDPYHPLFLAIFVFLTAEAWSLSRQHFFDWKQPLFLTLIALLIRLTLRFLLIEPSSPGKKLRI